MDRNRTATEIESTARQASEPFPGNGDQHGAVLPSASANEAPPASSSDAAAAAAVTVASTPVELLCKCGAGPHAERDGFCANSHPLKGHGGKLSLKHGLYAQQPIDADGAVMASLSDYRYDALCRNFYALEQQTLKFAESMQRPGRVKDRELKALHAMSDSLRSCHADLQAMESSMTQEQVWAKVCRVFMRRAGDFTELVCDVLQQHPQFAPTLRAALAAHDGLPQVEREPDAGVPVMQVSSDGKPRPVCDEPDEMLL